MQPSCNGVRQCDMCEALIESVQQSQAPLAKNQHVLDQVFKTLDQGSKNLFQDFKTASNRMEIVDRDIQQTSSANHPLVEAEEDEIQWLLNVDHPIEVAKEHEIQQSEETGGHEMDSLRSAHAPIEEAGGMIQTGL